MVEKVTKIIQENPKVSVAVTAVVAAAGTWLAPLIKLVAPMLGLTCS